MNELRQILGHFKYKLSMPMREQDSEALTEQFANTLELIIAKREKIAARAYGKALLLDLQAKIDSLGPRSGLSGMTQKQFIQSAINNLEELD